MTTAHYRQVKTHRSSELAFALPVVLISAVVLLIVLMSAVTATVSIRTAMSEQMYKLMAQTAAESGLAYAQMCIDTGASETWTALKPNTDCNGTESVACPTSLRDSRCGVIDSPTLRTTFTVGTPVLEGRTLIATVTGEVQRLRASNSAAVWQTHTTTLTRSTAQVNDPVAKRATERFWYFGSAVKMDFGASGSNPPVISYDTANAYAGEGVTVVTDKTGQLIFRSNGREVRDSSGAVMQNSDGLNANNSATQAVVAFPLDRVGVKYAIVTNTTINEPGGEGELYYSVVDMSLNGGLGAVDPAKKNIKLGTATGYAAEALTAAPNAGGDGYWVYTYTPGTNNILGFQFKLDGTVSASPVISYTSSVIRKCIQIGYGSLYFDKAQTTLLMNTGTSGCPAPEYNASTLRLLDMNTATGVLTERLSWLAGTSQHEANSSNSGYTADFSPSEKYVYYSQIYPARVYRYNIENATSGAAIKATEEFVGFPSSVFTGGGHIRRAPDGKMYVANNGYANISVIDRPDELFGSIGWRPQAITLPSGSVSRFGLPQMVTLFDPLTIFY